MKNGSEAGFLYPTPEETDDPYYFVKLVERDGEKMEAFFATWGERTELLGERVDFGFGQDTAEKLVEKYKDNEEISVVVSKPLPNSTISDMRADAFRKIDPDSDEYTSPRDPMDIDSKETYTDKEIEDYL